jgi:DNA-binding transcriptional LysR family regulator
MRLDIDSLRTFKTVLETGGVTRAARKLHLTQSAVSHKLARLEVQIGRPILVKRPGGIAPTAEGQSLLGYAERLVALHDEAAERFRPSKLAGHVRLGATEDTTGEKLAAVLGRFKRLHPQVSLNIRVAQSLLLQRWLNAAEIDLAIMQIFVDDKRPGDHELWREDLIWIGAQDYALEIGSRVPFVAFDENCFYRQAASQALARQRRSLDIVLECPTAAGVAAGVWHGLGIAVVGRRHLRKGLIEITSGLPAFPQICHVLRSRNGLAVDLEESIADAVLPELTGQWLEQRASVPTK